MSTRVMVVDKHTRDVSDASSLCVVLEPTLLRRKAGDEGRSQKPSPNPSIPVLYMLRTSSRALQATVSACCTCECIFPKFSSVQAQAGGFIGFVLFLIDFFFHKPGEGSSTYNIITKMSGFINFICVINFSSLLVTMVYPRTWEAEARELLQIQGKPGIHNTTLSQKTARASFRVDVGLERQISEPRTCRPSMRT